MFAEFYNAYKDLPSEKSYMYLLTNEHPLGLIFGITILIVNSLCIHWAGTVNVIKHLCPACGSVRYTPEEIDEQANHPESVWYNNAKIYITPKTIIGTQKGMSAAEFTDIEKAYMRARWHTERTTPYYKTWAFTKRKEYYKYQLVIRTKNHKKLIMSNSQHFEKDIIETLKEKCGPEVWIDRKLPEN